jgi:hypothetical protein
MNIRSQSAPVLSGQPKVSFNDEAFDAAIWNQGWNVTHEEARICPCRSRESGSPLLTCQNCRGFGLFFINPITTKAIISGVNKKNKYGEEWSEVSIGTISATLMNINKLAENDRLTFMDVVSKRSETLNVREVDGQLFVFLTYKPVEIIDVFVLELPTTPLIKLAITDYALSTDNEYVLMLNFVPPSGFNNTVVVTYYNNPQYMVIDLPHDLRASTIMNSNGQLVKTDLPVQAIFKKAHLCLSLSDYEGGVDIINNSYK